MAPTKSIRIQRRKKKELHSVSYMDKWKRGRAFDIGKAHKLAKKN